MSKFRLLPDKNLVRIARKYGKDMPINQRELDILEKNMMNGFFRPQTEGRKKIVYTAPSGKPLAIYKKNITVHKLYGVLAQIVEVTKRIENYGLYLNNLILDERLIYARELTGELFFLYEPVRCRENGTNLFAFLPDWISSIKSDDQNVQSECEKLKTFLADPANYRREHIEDFIASAYPQIYQQVARSNVSTKGAVQKQNAVKEEMGTILLKEEEEGTTLLGDEEGTMLLSEAGPAGKLCRLKNDDVILLSGDEFRIGKDRGCDYCINDNMAVSRNHAVILCGRAGYVIRDEHSMNHSYVNGKIVPPGEERELQNGDVIRLADEDFTFYME